MTLPKINGLYDCFKMKRANLAGLCFVALFFVFCFRVSAEQENAAVLAERLVIEGKKLEKQGQYEAALEKYKASLMPDLNRYHVLETSARGALRELYIKWGKYEEAQEATRWFTEGKKELKIATQEAVWEVDALIAYQKTGNPEKIVNFIKHLKEQYKESLPPNNWNTFTDIPVTTILRLYNHIGDHDSGIKLIDDCLLVFKKFNAGRYDPDEASIPYLKVRTGFEQDKAEGFKGCAGQKTGEICMGHATQAIIQSDYFPW